MALSSDKWRNLTELNRIPLPSVIHYVAADADVRGRNLFIVGDIHGCLDEFKLLLRQANVSADTHLVICCGDIVNKGPLSRETVSFLRSHGPNEILSVRGNHDEMVSSLIFFIPNERI